MLKYSFYGDDEKADSYSEQRALQSRYEDGLRLIKNGDEKGNENDYQQAVSALEHLIQDLGSCLIVDGDSTVKHRFKARLKEVCLKNLGLCFVKLNHHQRALECYMSIMEECKDVILWLQAADAAKGAGALYAARYFASTPLLWKNLTSTENQLVRTKSREMEEWCQHLLLVGALDHFSGQVITDFTERKEQRFTIFVADRTMESLLFSMATRMEAADVPIGEVNFYVDCWPETGWTPTKLSTEAKSVIRAVGQYLSCVGHIPKNSLLELEQIVNLVRTGGRSSSIPDPQEVSDVEDFCKEYVPWRTAVKRLLQIFLQTRLKYMPKSLQYQRAILALYQHYVIRLHLRASDFSVPWDFKQCDLSDSLKKFLAATLVSAAEIAYACHDQVAFNALMGMIFECGPFPDKTRMALEHIFKGGVIDIDQFASPNAMDIRCMALMSDRPGVAAVVEKWLKTSGEIQCTTHVIRKGKLSCQRRSEPDEDISKAHREASVGLRHGALTLWYRLRNQPDILEGETVETRLDTINNEDMVERLHDLARCTRILKESDALRGTLFTSSPIGDVSWSYLLLIITALVSTRLNLLPICHGGIAICCRHLCRMLREVSETVELIQIFGLLVTFHDCDVALGVRFQSLAPQKPHTVEFCYPLHWVVNHERFQGAIDFNATDISGSLPLPHMILTAVATIRCAKLESWHRLANIQSRSRDFTTEPDVSRSTAWIILRVLTAWIGGTKDSVLFEKERLRDKALNNRSLECLRKIAAPLGMYRKHMVVDEFRKFNCEGLEPDDVEAAVTRFVAQDDVVEPVTMFGSCVAGPTLDVQIMGLLWSLQLALYARPAGSNCTTVLLQHLNPLVYGEKTYNSASNVPMMDNVGYLFHPLIMPRFYMLPLRMADRKNGLYPIMMEPVMRLIARLNSRHDYWCDDMKDRVGNLAIGKIWREMAVYLEQQESDNPKLICDLLQQIEPVPIEEPLSDVYLECAKHSQGTDIQFLNNNSAFTRGSPTLLFCTQDLAHKPLRWETMEIAARTFQILFLARRDEKCARHALSILDVCWWHYETALQTGEEFVTNAPKWFAIQRDRMWLYFALKQKPVAQHIAEDLISFLVHYTDVGLEQSFAKTKLNFQYGGPPIEFSNSLVYFLLCLTRVAENIEEAKRWTTTKHPHCLQLLQKVKSIKLSSSREDLKKIQMKTVMGDVVSEYVAWLAVAGVYCHFDSYEETMRCLEKAQEQRHVETPTLEHASDIICNLRRYKYARKSKFNKVARRAYRGLIESTPSIRPIINQPWPECEAPALETVTEKRRTYNRIPACTLLSVVPGLEIGDYNWCLDTYGPNWSLVEAFFTLKSKQANIRPLFEKACAQVFLDACGLYRPCETPKTPPGYLSWNAWHAAVIAEHPEIKNELEAPSASHEVKEEQEPVAKKRKK